MPRPCTDVTLSNCILWDNSSPGGAELAVLTDDFYDEYPSMLTVSYCDVEGGEAAAFVERGNTLIWADGSFSAGPLFVDPTGDWRLSSGSPCIDAGDSAAVPEDVTFDIVGHGRFVDDPKSPDVGNPDGVHSMVDIGAPEFSGCGADTNGDGVVDVTDLVNVLLDWGTDGSEHGGDFDGNGVVDEVDLVSVIVDWGACQ